MTSIETGPTGKLLRRSVVAALLADRDGLLAIRLRGLVPVLSILRFVTKPQVLAVE